MAADLNYMSCCGIRELVGLSGYQPFNPVEVILDLHLGRPRFKYIVFSQAGRESTYGEEFAAYIMKHKLGDLATIEKAHVNPNSHRPLRVWIWALAPAVINRHIAALNKAAKGTTS